MDIFKRNYCKPINLSISTVQKRILESRKQVLLKPFEIDDASLREQLLIKNSPTSDMMKQIIYYMTNRRTFSTDNNNNDKAITSDNNLNGSSLKKSMVVNSMKYNRTVPKIYGKIIGNRPCARDGHSGILLGNKMLVFGGNRHKIGFNDLYELDLEKLT